MKHLEEECDCDNTEHRTYHRGETGYKRCACNHLELREKFRTWDKELEAVAHFMRTHEVCIAE